MVTTKQNLDILHMPNGAMETLGSVLNVTYCNATCKAFEQKTLTRSCTLENQNAVLV